jgi:hypothetical protein
MNENWETEAHVPKNVTHPLANWTNRHESKRSAVGICVVALSFLYLSHLFKHQMIDCQTVSHFVSPVIMWLASKNDVISLKAGWTNWENEELNCFF